MTQANLAKEEPAAGQPDGKSQEPAPRAHPALRVLLRFLALLVLLEVLVWSLSWIRHFVHPRYESVALIQLRESWGGVGMDLSGGPDGLDSVSRPLMERLCTQLTAEETGHWSMRSGYADSSLYWTPTAKAYQAKRQRFTHEIFIEALPIFHLTFEYSQPNEAEVRMEAALYKFQVDEMTKDRKLLRQKYDETVKRWAAEQNPALRKSLREEVSDLFAMWENVPRPLTILEQPTLSRPVLLYYRPLTHAVILALAMLLSLLYQIARPRESAAQSQAGT